MRRVTVAMLILGGLVCASAVWTVQDTPESRMAQGIIAIVFLVAGAFVMLAPARGRRFFDAVAIWSVLLLSLLIALSDPLGMAPVFYLWPAVFVAYFSTTRVVLAVYWLAVVTLTAALVHNPAIDLKLDVFVCITSTMGLVTALVHWLTLQETQLRGELARAAATDPLTGLLNRRSFDPRLEAAVAASGGRRQPLGLVVIDIDHFKALNDEHGHLVGDRALQALAEILMGESREHDLVARLGGEEFAVALPHADLDVARRFIERVAARLAVHSGSAPYTLAVSAGIATTGEGLDAAALAAVADEALYAAKEAGRCRHAWWEDGIEVGHRFDEVPTA
ncbi:MAG: diguanylate cyclase domain-containing protein [Acidimicrobiales bacterium]